MTRQNIRIPANASAAEIALDSRTVQLTNLRKPFWPGIKKRDLIQYYADVASVLLPHIRDRAMVMKRYPNGASGEFFFMKRAPEPRPPWIRTCSIKHGSGNVIHFPVIDDAASLLWVINLGCIDLNPWYARCDDTDRPDYVVFDLDPVEPASFARVREAALILRDALDALKMPSFPKTTGSRGIHVYVPIMRGPRQKEVWEFAKALATSLAHANPKLLTAIYRVADRPRNRVLVDYNQNAWGRTLASIYSVRPKPRAPVSAPLAWSEVEEDIAIEDFRIDNMAQRIRRRGDLWKGMLHRSRRARLDKYLTGRRDSRSAT